MQEAMDIKRQKTGKNGSDNASDDEEDMDFGYNDKSKRWKTKSKICT